MEKYNVDSMNDLINKTWKLIDNDPLLNATEEIDNIKKNFEAIHQAINNTQVTSEERKWFLAAIFGRMIGKEEGFQYKSFESKINSIFRQFDLTFTSVENSIEIYTEYGTGLTWEISKLDEFLKWVKEEELEGNDIGEFRNYTIMLENLRLSLWRIEMSMKSAKELHETMRTWRPIFQALLSSCMIEVAWQRSIDASVQMLWTISGTIEWLSQKLTESTVKTSQIALEVGSKPVLCAGKLQDNMLMLKWAIDDLEERKNKYLLTNWKKEW